jgi:hypothetical protein
MLDELVRRLFKRLKSVVTKLNRAYGSTVSNSERFAVWTDAAHPSIFYQQFLTRLLFHFVRQAIL